jgi:hypothetical protein
MIQDIDETLRRLLAAELIRTPGCPVRDREQITFDPPAEAEALRDGEARVNLYLHDLRENVELRDESYHLLRKPEEGLAGKRRGPVRLDVSYLVTVYAGDDPGSEHRLLADVLGVFLRCLATPVEHLAGALEGKGSNALLLEVAQPDHLANLDPPALWQSLGGKLRPALSLVVTAPFDPFDTKWTRVVREALLGSGPAPTAGMAGAPVPRSAARVSAAGIVLDGDSEAPIEGAAVRVAGRPEETETDERGFFCLMNLPPGAHTLNLWKRGFGRVEHAVEAPSPGRADQVQPTVIALRRLNDADAAAETAARAEEALNSPGLVEADREYHVSLSGRLRFTDGRSAGFIPLRVGRQKTRSDGDGVFYFSDLPAGGDRTLFAEVPGRGEVEVVSRGGAATIPPPAARGAAARASDRATKEDEEKQT